MATMCLDVHPRSLCNTHTDIHCERSAVAAVDMSVLVPTLCARLRSAVLGVMPWPLLTPQRLRPSLLLRLSFRHIRPLAPAKPLLERPCNSYRGHLNPPPRLMEGLSTPY
jgi:hypothetical protein